MSRDAEASPETIVACYYRALRSGDMDALREMMVPESYHMTLEAYGFKRTFTDPQFKKLLHRSETDDAALCEVEAAVAETLRRDANSKQVAELRTEMLGADRCAVYYTEDGTPKKLTFSQTGAGWKIDYYAGRKRDG